MGISRDSDDDGLRWYTDGDVDVLSVTTVLKFLEEDTTGLERWQAKNDGSGDSPHHEHIFWYSGPRGTLCHYDALSAFEHAFDGEEMWGEEEASSMEAVVRGPDEEDFDDDASTDLDDITYSILHRQDVVSSRDEYAHLFRGNTRLVDVLQQDREYFTEAFHDICDELGVDDESVISVEQYLVNADERYGGQCDLLYEDPGGNVVLADLKTSSSLRQKHRLQSVAYKKAVEQTDGLPDEVDRVEVWRIFPDGENWQVHSHEVPDHATHLHDEDESESSAYTDAFWFDDKWGSFSYQDIEDMWETFTDLVDEAEAAAEEMAEDDDDSDD